MPIKDEKQANTLIDKLQYRSLKMSRDYAQEKMKEHKPSFFRTKTSGSDYFQAAALTGRTRAFSDLLDCFSPDENWEFYQTACEKYPQLHETAVSQESFKFYDVLLEKFQESGNPDQNDKSEKRRDAILESLMTEFDKSRPEAKESELKKELIWLASKHDCTNLRQAIYATLPEQDVQAIRTEIFSDSVNHFWWTNGISDDTFKTLCREFSSEAHVAR